jgi:molybdenum cofactor guanylyltransferase
MRERMRRPVALSSRRASDGMVGDAAGFVLAGGQSSRMGQDKALLPFAGQPLIQRALTLLHEAGLTASIAGARSPSLAEFAPVVDDSEPGLGPLASSAQYAVFLPVDLPLLPPSLIVYLLHHACVSSQVVTLPKLSGFTETFPAVLDRCIFPILRSALEAGRYGCYSVFQTAAISMGQSVNGISVECLAQSGQVAHPLALPPFRWFLNLNSQADIAEARALLAGRIA